MALLALGPAVPDQAPALQVSARPTDDAGNPIFPPQKAATAREIWLNGRTGRRAGPIQTRWKESAAPEPPAPRGFR